MFHAKKDLKIERLSQVELFRRCSAPELMDLASIADEVDLPAGYQLCREGGVAQECFVIVRGEAAVEIDGEVVAIIGPGETVGEMGLIERKPRSATVRTLTSTSAYVIARNQFDELLRRHPTVARLILAELSVRLRRAEDPDRPARVPVGAAR